MSQATDHTLKTDWGRLWNNHSKSISVLSQVLLITAKGRITDQRTGLMWQKVDDAIGRQYKRRFRTASLWNWQDIATGDCRARTN